MQDLIGGQIPAYFGFVADFLPYLQTGKVRILGVAAEKRSVFLPAVATFAEQGFAKIRGGETYGVFAPPGTPEATIKSLHESIVAGQQGPGPAHCVRAGGPRDLHPGAAGLRPADPARARVLGTGGARIRLPFGGMNHEQANSRSRPRGAHRARRRLPRGSEGHDGRHRDRALVEPQVRAGQRAVPPSRAW
jgi:hypothetical protein